MSIPSLAHLWSRLSLRARLMVLGTGGLVMGLTIAGLAMVVAMDLALRRTVDAAANGTITSIVTMVEEDGQLPEPIPVPAGQIAQVIDEQRRVTDASADADRLVPLLRPDEQRAALAGKRVDIPGHRVLRDQPMRVFARSVPSTGAVVLVAVPVGDFATSVALLRVALLITYPMLVVVLALVGWRVVTAALAPVERLRVGAARITGSGADLMAAQRLPVPASRDEIYRLAVTLNDMLDRLAAARGRQRAFVADAAHELRSPLASMRVQLEVAKQLGDWDAVADDILLDVDRLSRLVDDLLLLARADDGGRPVAMEPVELGALLRDVAARYPSAHVEADAPVWTVGRPDGLRRILLNLVDNAARHAMSRVDLAAREAGGRILVTVTDDGPGIAPADRRRAFDRFTRLDEARDSAGGGAGLGLAIVRELVRQHSGTVRLTDVPGGASGLRVEVSLPAANAI